MTTNPVTPKDAAAVDVEWLKDLNAKVEAMLNDPPQVDQLNVPTAVDDALEIQMKLMDAASESTAALILARKALLVATLELNDAKARYEDGKRDAYLMGSVVGKNAEERDARLASLLEVQTGNIRRAEAGWLKAKVEVECNQDATAGFELIQAIAGLGK